METESQRKTNPIGKILAYIIPGLLVILILLGLPDYGFFLTTLRLLILGILLLVFFGLFVLLREIFGNRFS